MRHSARQYAATLFAAVEGKTEKETESLVRHFLTLLRKEKARKLLPAIVKAFSALMHEKAGEQEALVTTARPHDIKPVQHALEKTTGQKMLVQHITDRRLLGGVIVRIGDMRIDASIRSRLEALRAKLHTTHSIKT